MSNHALEERSGCLVCFCLAPPPHIVEPLDILWETGTASSLLLYTGTHFGVPQQVEGSVEGFNFGESEAGGLGTAPPLRKRDIPTPIIATVAGESPRLPSPR